MHRDVYGGRLARVRSPFVGRDALLGELEEVYRRVHGDVAASVVLLWGEAGVGKTRLLDEFAARVLAAGARIGVGTCVEGLCPPFAPLREAFSSLGLPPPFEPGDDRFGTSVASEVKRYRDFRAAADALAATAVPNVVLLDDLHWADFATLEFLAFVALKLEQAPVLVLATVRSEDLERDHARLDALNTLLRNGARRINVDPLPQDEMRRLVSMLWPADSPQRALQIERVCALAEGKPYFAEELIGSGTASAPPSIRASVLARFERLSRAERDVLRQAAVIGQTFDLASVARLAKTTTAQALAAAASARDLQLVRELEDPQAFAFRHAITREILYREMLQLQRQTIHREVAHLLQDQVPPADAGQIASHWNAAGERERATRAYELAGDRATARNAHRDAEDAYRFAVHSRDAADAGLAELYEKFSRTLSIGGNLAEACLYLQRAVDAFEARGDRLKAAQLAARLARRYFECARKHEASESILRALRLCDGHGSIAFDAHVTLAHFAALQGNLPDADEQLRLAEHLTDPWSPAQRRDFHMVRALVRASAGRLAAAYEDYERAVAVARAMGDPEQLCWALGNYASRALATGHTDRALAAYRESLAMQSLDEFGKVGALAKQGFASACLMSGDLAGAQLAHDRGRHGTSTMALTHTAAVAMDVRLAYLMDEALPLEQAVIDRALSVAFDSGEPQNIGLLAGALAAYYDAAARPSEALALRTRAIAAIASTDLCFWLIDQLAASVDEAQRVKARSLLCAAAADEANFAARAHLLLFDARVARRERRSALAKSLALEAADAFAAIGWPWERAAALEIAGRHAQAREIYERHGYRRQLRELDRSRRRVRHRAAADRLTPRELEVALLAAEGRSNQEIAARLFIGERTVETHIAAIFDRFDLTSRRQLAALVANQPG